jgi:hypothetical protein
LWWGRFGVYVVHRFKGRIGVGAYGDGLALEQWVNHDHHGVELVGR